MAIYLKDKARTIATERGINWDKELLDDKFWKIEHSLKNKIITKGEAVEEAAKLLKIEKAYDPHYKRLEDSIKE